MTNKIILPKQLTNTQLPTRREHLAELHKRGALDTDFLAEYKSLESGYQGEQLVYQYLQEFGDSNWTILRNVWLNYSGNFEIDQLLLTNQGPKIFEVKNLTGDYEFKNNQCWRDGELRGQNPIAQSQKSFANTSNIFKRFGFNQPIEAALVFTGNHFSLNVQENVGDLNILFKTDLRKYIWEIAEADRLNQSQNFNIDRAINTLSKFEIHNPFPAHSLTPEMENKIRKGILCSHCGASNIYRRVAYLTCDCGMTEPRENAIVRTICEYGIIYYNNELSTGKLLDFFDYEISKGTLLSYLNKHFIAIGTGKNTTYKNPRKSINNVHPKFKLKNTRYYRC